MKPVTPEQYAKCYGTFIANIMIAGQPSLVTWFSSTFPDLNLIYKLNKSIFTRYPASVKTFPRVPTEKEARQSFFKDGVLSTYFNAMRVDLKNALSSAEIDPTQTDKIIKSFNSVLNVISAKLK